MHRHLYRVEAQPAPRPAKVVALEARREARLQATAPKPPPPKAA
jgi:hypothetical protein